MEKKSTIPVFAAVFFAGIASLQMELSLLREATFVLSATAFTNSFIISVFLAGLAAGCYAGSGLTRRYPNRARLIFSVSQLGMILTVVLFALTKSFVIYYNYRLKITLPYFLVMTFVPAFIGGMSFSLFLNILYGYGEKFIASVYAVSTVGNVVGGFLHGMVLVPYAGMTATYIAIAACAAASLLCVGGFAPRWNAVVVFAAALAALLVWKVRPLPAEVAGSMLFSKDDTYGLVQVFDRGNSWTGRGGVRGLEVFVHGSYNCGNSEEDLLRHEASGRVADAMLGHRTRDVAMLGYCSGSTLDGLLELSHLDSIVAVEQNRTVIEMADKFFPDIGARLKGDPRVRVHIGEFKNYLRRLPDTGKKDVIMVDITLHDPYLFGFFTKEFFELIKSRLRTPGVFASNIIHPQFLRTAGEVFAHVYRATEGPARDWYYLTDAGLEPSRLRELGLSELNPRTEAGVVYGDHKIYRLKANERLND